MPSTQLHTGHAGSARLVFKAGEELVAITFPVPKTGYKSPGAYGSRPVFRGESTNEFYQKQVLGAGEGKAKKLEPYRAKAPRNRPKYLLENIAGTRHKLHPCIKHETYRGSSKVKLADGNVDSQKPWKTMNQVRETTGMANQGISSDIARRLHKKQEIYGTH